MGWSFRKSKKIGGVRLSVGKKSGSASVGGKWFRYTVNSKGQRTSTFGIPGTGLRWSSRSKSPKVPSGAGSHVSDEQLEQLAASGGATALGCLAVLAALVGVPILGCCGFGIVGSIMSPTPVAIESPAEPPAAAVVEAVPSSEPVVVEPIVEPVAVVAESEPTIAVVNEPSYKLRPWTDSTGKHTRLATLVSLSDGKVTLRKEDGSETTLPLERLSEFDRQYVDAMLEQ